MYTIKFSLYLSALFLSPLSHAQTAWFLPIALGDRTAIDSVPLTPIGAFGLPRKARPAGLNLRVSSDSFRWEKIYHGDLY